MNTKIPSDSIPNEINQNLANISNISATPINNQSDVTEILPNNILNNNDSSEVLSLNSATDPQLAFYLYNLSDSSELINSTLPYFTAYIAGNAVKILADCGAQRSVACSNAFFTKNKSNITNCDIVLRAANHNIFEVHGALISLKVDVFPTFAINLTNVPILSSLPCDLILGYPDLCELGFSIPKGVTSYFFLR